MFIVAFLLGLWFGALSKIGCRWGHARLVDADAQQAARVKAGAQIAVFILAAITLVLIIVACLHAVDDYYYGRVADKVDAFMGFLALPTNIGVLLAFIAGAMAVWFWRYIKKFMQDYHLMRPAVPSGNASTPKTASAALDGENEPYPWLTRIVGIAAVTLVALVALVAFYPGLLMNLQVLRVAGVEARFATTAQHTVRVAAQTSKAKFVTNYILDAWLSVDNVIDNYSVKAQEVVLAQKNSKTKGGRIELLALHHAKDFLDRYAVPLADVMSCYSRDFVINESHFQPALADLANDWARFAFQANYRSKKTSKDPVLFAATQAVIRIRFKNLTDETDKVFNTIRSDLEKRQSACGITATDDTPYKYEGKLDQGKQKEIVQNLKEILANGYILTFIADMLMLTHKPEHVIEFLEKMKPFLDTSDETLTGQINYFYKIANARYQYDYWTSEDANRELTAAQSRVEVITNAYSASETDNAKRTHSCQRPDKFGANERDKVWAYYCGIRVFIINLRAINVIRDWIEGRELAPSTVETLKEWTAALVQWAQHASVHKIITEKSGRPQWVADIDDTIALAELAVATTEGTLSKTTCVKIANQLLKSKEAWDALRGEYVSIAERLVEAEQRNELLRQFDRETYLAALQTYHAHQDLYRGACGQYNVQ